MQKSAFFHITHDNYAYMINDTIIEIRIKTGKDVNSVILHHNDSYAFHSDLLLNNHTNMEFYGEGVHHYFFTVRVNCPTHRLKYFFELKNKEETLYFSESSISNTLQIDEHAPFVLPYNHSNKQLSSVDWVSTAQWYQIFPDRFHKVDNTSTRQFHEWNKDEVSNKYHYGGNIKGITNKLDYLQDLGINAIYLTPIFEAKTSHKYDTMNYFKIDPDFGTEDDFIEMVTIAHQKGIKIILDAVFNHSGSSFEPWLDVLEHKHASHYFDWFHVHESNNGIHYEMFGNSKNMPKLNTQNPEVKEYLLKAALYWTTLAPIDGWRLDVANEVDSFFWRDFRAAIKGVNPNAYILGEVWHDAKPWLRGDQFDGVMNYPLTNLIKKTLLTKDIDYYRKNYIDITFRYPKPILGMQFNILDSHDTARITSHLKDINLLKCAYVLLFSSSGTPCIFYGSEILLQGENDPFCRQLMKFDNFSEQEQEFHSWMKQLQQIRHLNPTFGNHGNVTFLPNNHLLVYDKQSEESTIRFYFNFTELAHTINASGVDLFQNKLIELSYILEPSTFLVLKLR